jgi:hypothetical protein
MQSLPPPDPGVTAPARPGRLGGTAAALPDEHERAAVPAVTRSLRRYQTGRAEWPRPRRAALLAAAAVCPPAAAVQAELLRLEGAAGPGVPGPGGGGELAGGGRAGGGGRAVGGMRGVAADGGAEGGARGGRGRRHWALADGRRRSRRARALALDAAGWTAARRDGGGVRADRMMAGRMAVSGGDLSYREKGAWVGDAGAESESVPRPLPAWPQWPRSGPKAPAQPRYSARDRAHARGCARAGVHARALVSAQVWLSLPPPNHSPTF